jgi:hypothetical protein
MSRGYWRLLLVALAVVLAAAYYRPHPSGTGSKLAGGMKIERFELLPPNGGGSRSARIVVYNRNYTGVSRMRLTCTFFDQQGHELGTRQLELAGGMSLNETYVARQRKEKTVSIGAVGENASQANCTVADAWWW